MLLPFVGDCSGLPDEAKDGVGNGCLAACSCLGIDCRAVGRVLVVVEIDGTALLDWLGGGGGGGALVWGCGTNCRGDCGTGNT